MSADEMTLVERLRCGPTHSVVLEAVDRIEELEAENERLKSALEIEREIRRLVKEFLS